MNAATVAAFDAVALLESLRERGATISIKGTGAAAWLLVAPRGVLSDSERANLRRHKREIIAALNTPNDAPTVAHRWQSAATGDTATATAAHPAAPDVATVRAQLRALDLAIGAPASIGAIVRATRELDARQTRDTRKQWRAMAPDLKHAEAVATALLDNGIDPATVPIGAPAIPQAAPDATQPRRPARDLLAFWRGRGVSLTMETVERDGANWRALAVDLEHVAPEQRDAIFEELQPNARELERALAIEAAGGVAAYVAQQSAPYWSRKMAEVTK